MDQLELDNYIKAGKIAAQALEYGKSLIKPGVLLVDIAEKVEAKIKELGGEPAFPVQISLNETAAHYCPEQDDKTILNDQLVCLDVGGSVDGFIGDNACTVDLSGKNNELVKASEEALKNAIAIIKPGVSLGEIGKVIEETITKYGFRPVKNLSGHGLERYNIHSEPTIPNYNTGDDTQLEDGQVIAIEPFATNGVGMIGEKGLPNVFQLIQKKPVRSAITREVLKEIENYKGTPFTMRWLIKKFGLKARFALKELKNLECIKEYPPLVERSNGLVSQAEHTILVREKPVILTKA